MNPAERDFDNRVKELEEEGYELIHEYYQDNKIAVLVKWDDEEVLKLSSCAL